MSNSKDQPATDEKDKKIGQLRGILAQAKTKIEALRAQVIEKDKALQQSKKNYQKKIKTLEDESSQIIKQYQQRLITYQKSLQESDSLVSKYQKQVVNHGENIKQFLNGITQINNLTTKVFTLGGKQNSDAVQQLCNIQKCKEYLNQLDKIVAQQLEPVTKTIRKLVDLYTGSLSRKRQTRLSLMKKQTQLKKNLQQDHEKNEKMKNQITLLKKQLAQKDAIWQRKIEEVAKNKAKISQDKINQQFIKQLVIKVVLGPKQASLMAFEVLNKVLKMSDDQYDKCRKKIK